jgi:peptidoglycan/LPS O-acetylase OafA/YrhL
MAITTASSRILPADRPGTRLGYRPALDGIRAVAIVLVLLHHTGAFLVPRWQSSFFPGGFLGVDVFLVLSGFLITTLLLERRERERRPIATFYLRRVLRLFPALIALLVANLLYALVTGHGVGDALRSVVVVGVYMTNWAALAGISISPYVTHLWSLAIEEQFYLVWPPILYGALRLGQSRWRLVWLAGGIALLSAVWRLALYQSGDPWLRVYIRTDARADALAIGCLLALLPWAALWQRLPAAVRALAGPVSLAVIVAAAAGVQPYAPVLYRGGFTVIAVFAAVLIASALGSEGWLNRVLASRPAVIVGRLSYSLYLWHFGIFQIVAAHTASWPSLPRVALAWALSFLFAGASYRFVELPALRLKRHLGRPKTSAAPGVPAG